MGMTDVATIKVRRSGIVPGRAAERDLAYLVAGDQQIGDLAGIAENELGSLRRHSGVVQLLNQRVSDAPRSPPPVPDPTTW